ncbi:exodeoxyribonuclease V subunit gamma [Leptospira ilyithenensis]|uniref:Exonuclease V subunit gamma n=1 Tax=Leptospira ilyithenensis TaxID=2484901 RepID=A0A4R9LR58_9LEPT|nr:exodeoxyribonuclease V subunit gamma [Leptospira ilyithenensis]TGN12021.1 exonuclease V subunit gamma [Leptospira ilyithenensis]
MPIQHFTSLSLHDISSLLSDNLWEERKKYPLKAPTVVIPNLNMRRWLDLNLAKIGGLSTLVRYQFLERFFEEYYLGRAGKEYDPLVRTFPGPEKIQKKILSYLIQNKEKKEFGFLSSYLTNIPRVFSLSSKLALLFRDYELNRSGWIEDWAKENRIEIPSVSKKKSELPNDNDYLRMEKRVYQDIFLDPSLSEENLQSSIHFFLKEAKKKKENFVNEFSSVHLFCLSNLADTYLGILESISEADDFPVYIYQFHNGLSHIPKDSLIPVTWSRPQVQTYSRIRNMRKTSQKDISPKQTYPEGLGALRKLLSGQLKEPYTSSEYSSTKDFSVRFWNAPSVFREMEAVANDILYQLNQNPELSYVDFAILLTDIKTYRPTVEWVFDGGLLIQSSETAEPIRKKIPYSLTDIKASDSSYLYQGCMVFWDLCSGVGITKDTFLSLLHNPLFLSKSNIDNETLLRLEELIELTGVQYEEKGREEEGFQISSGLRRIRLSSVLDSDSSWDNYGEMLLSMESEEDPVVLTEIWELVFQTRNRLRLILEKRNWGREEFLAVREILESLFDLSPDSGEVNLFHSFLESLSEWEGLEKLSETDGIQFLRFVTEQAFDKIPYRKGDYLTGGVTISLLQPMRPIPFKHVYILGLGEGKFPGSKDLSPLNLRKDVPEDWDINRKEVGESLFWESLHSADESITLSYVGKNIQEDKLFEPCSSLYELMFGLGVEAATEIPLHSYSKLYTHKEEELKRGLLSFDFSKHWLSMDRKDHSLLSRFQDPASLEIISKTNPHRLIHLKEISQFLEDPLSAYLSKRMGMYLNEEETDREAGELFTIQELGESVILKSVYEYMIPDLVGNGDWPWDESRLKELLSAEIKKEKAKAKFPQSVYAEVKEGELLRFLLITNEIFKTWNPEFAGGTYHRFFSLGDTGLSESVCKKIPSLKIGAEEIVGEWEHVIEKNGIHFWILPKLLEKNPEVDWNGYSDYWKKMSFPFLSSLAVLASELSDFRIYSFRSRPKGDTKKKGDDSFLLRYKTKEPKENLSYLSKLISLYQKEEPYFFPRYAFLEYYINVEKAAGKNSNLPSLTEIYGDELSWKRYLNEEVETIQSGLDSIVRLYPDLHSMILESSLGFAEDFYQPFLDWRIHL